MIRVLIAEDSPSIQRLLTTLLSDQHGIEVIGVANNGVEAVSMCRDLKPDLVTMDIYMPEMNGLEATQWIMQEHPTRIVIISSIVDSDNLRNSFEAIHSGAVELIEKPHGVLRGDYSRVKRELIRVIEQIMQAKPNRQPYFSLPASQPSMSQHQEASRLPTERQIDRADLELIPQIDMPDLICVGGSTGAPVVLSTILSQIPADFPVPIAIVQHIARGFMKGMVKWLNSVAQIKVRIAQSGDLLRPGLVLVAPDDMHMQVRSSGRVRLFSPSRNDRHIPSIDRMFESVATTFGSRGLGIVLSGMGSDGCKGMMKMREQGAYTLVQNKESSVVYGMPKIAFEQGAAIIQLDPYQIIELLNQTGSSG